MESLKTEKVEKDNNDPNNNSQFGESDIANKSSLSNSATCNFSELYTINANKELDNIPGEAIGAHIKSAFRVYSRYDTVHLNIADSGHSRPDEFNDIGVVENHLSDVGYDKTLSVNNTEDHLELESEILKNGTYDNKEKELSGNKGCNSEECKTEDEINKLNTENVRNGVGLLTLAEWDTVELAEAKPSKYDKSTSSGNCEGTKPMTLDDWQAAELCEPENGCVIQTNASDNKEIKLLTLAEWDALELTDVMNRVLDTNNDSDLKIENPMSVAECDDLKLPEMERVSHNRQGTFAEKNKEVKRTYDLKKEKSNSNESKKKSFTTNLKHSFCSMFKFNKLSSVAKHGISINISRSLRSLPPIPEPVGTSTDMDDGNVFPSLDDCEDIINVIHNGDCQTDHNLPIEGKSYVFDFATNVEKVKDCGWYWGPISSEDSEKLLMDEPDGSFIVRDSSDDHHIFSLTFKLSGGVRHVRIEHAHGNFSFGCYGQFKSQTIVDFIESAMEHSRSGRYLFFLHRRPIYGPVRVQLIHPVSRFKRIQSLQHICRFVVLKAVRKDLISSLPIPPPLIAYLNEPQIYVEKL